MATKKRGRVRQSPIPRQGPKVKDDPMAPQKIGQVSPEIVEMINNSNEAVKAAENEFALAQNKMQDAYAHRDGISNHIRQKYGLKPNFVFNVNSKGELFYIPQPPEPPASGFIEGPQGPDTKPLPAEEVQAAVKKLEAKKK